MDVLHTSSLLLVFDAKHVFDITQLVETNMHRILISKEQSLIEYHVTSVIIKTTNVLVSQYDSSNSKTIVQDTIKIYHYILVPLI